MTIKYFQTTIFMAALLLFAACTDDELITDSNTTPEGTYSLEITSVAMVGDFSSQPWDVQSPQTRVSEYEYNKEYDVWETGDLIYVKFKGSPQVGTYRITDADKRTVEAVTPAYWPNITEEQTIIAWYGPQKEGTIDVSDQTDGLGYLASCMTTATYGSGKSINLLFKHQLAKVRVAVVGTAYEGNATGVTLSYPASYTLTDGSVVSSATENGTIQMHKSEIDGYYEALLPPGQIAAEGNPFTVTFADGKTQVFNLSEEMPLKEKTKNSVQLKMLNKGTTEIDLSSQVYEISDNDTYFFSGTGKYGIKVTGGSPHIYLGDATINTSGNVIDITGGSPTIHVQANNTLENKRYENNGAGIYVAEGSTVTITGQSRSDVLTAKAAMDAAGIGGYVSDNVGLNCGKIYISNVTVKAYGSQQISYSPGIGASKGTTVTHGKCEGIYISDATVYAYGQGGENNACPAIGCYETVPAITISGSDIYAYRGAGNNQSSYADWIGRGGNTSGYTGGKIQGTITNSTIYKYKVNPQMQTTSEGNVVYDDKGVGTEQSQ